MPRITFRCDPVLYDRLCQCASTHASGVPELSPIIREALAQYLGLRPRTRPTRDATRPTPRPTWRDRLTQG